MKRFQKLRVKSPQLYWTCRKIDFDKEIWYEKSPGCCGSMWFPYATQFLQKFPKVSC